MEKEWEHVFFTARLISDGKFVLPPRNRFPVLILQEKDRIKAACMITSWGGLFPLFRSIDPPDSKELKSLHSRLKNSLRRVYSIMGTEERVDLLTPFFDNTKSVPVHYRLMVKNRCCEDIPVPSGGDFSLCKAEPEDSAPLLGLELEYQKEEVFIDPSQVDNTRVYHNLRSSLAEQIVYYASDGHIPVAKGGTNARGLEWNQIGGVYTDRKYRNRGISSWLLDFTIRKLEEDGKKTVLFVKESNGPAERVYNKLGFEEIKKFNITYYI